MSCLALMIGMLVKSAWQIINVGMCLADVVQFRISFNPLSLFPCNYLNPHNPLCQSPTADGFTLP